MDKKDKILLLKNKKESFSLLLTQQVAIILAFLVVSTSVCATVILTFNQNKISILTVLFYILLLIIFVPKRMKEINNNVSQTKRIDSFLFSITKNEPIDEIFIERLYK